ncbi:MAG: ComEA family DNA-binding protein [Flavobacteriia bacterium]|jgi:competence protein ComEA|nr:helix-hairpin-helix domain-containing protein [Cryomorphaceae bacterium]
MSPNDDLYISKRNRQGVYVLIGICLIVVFIPRLIDSFTPEQTILIESEEIAQLKKAFREKEVNNIRISDHQRRFRVPPMKFNPNDYSLKEWMYLGLTKKQANVVLKFTKHGIQSNEELSRIFVISESLFQLIKDSTVYPTTVLFSRLQNSEASKKEKFKPIEINAASQSDIESIPGIGPFYAKNILRYRDRLGGFVRKEQLLEVWKMEEIKYLEIKEFIVVDPQSVNKIKLNTASADELKSHPYLNWNIANSLIKIRERKGGFKSVEEIKESLLVDEDLFNKLNPYVSL